MYRFILTILFLLPFSAVFCQPADNTGQQTPLKIYQQEKKTVPYDVTRKIAKQRRVATRNGNTALKKKNISNAVKMYRTALKADSSYAKAQYNAAIAHGDLQQYDSALTYYKKVYENSSAKPEQRAHAHYNAGNICLRHALAARDTGGYDGQSLKAAIEQYKSALRLDSHNEDARHNLSLAKKLLRPESQDGKGGNGQNQQDKNQKNQDNNQDQQNQNQDQQQQNQNQDQQQQNQNQQQKQKKQEQTNREAEQMLNAMKNNEQQTMRAVKMREAEKERRTGRPSRREKDW